MKLQNKFILYSIVLLSLFLLASTYILADENIPDKGARYIFKTWKYDIIDGSYVGTIHYKKIIYNSLGEDYNVVSFFESNTTKVKKAKLTVLSADGKELYSKEKNILINSVDLVLLEDMMITVHIICMQKLHSFRI